MSALCAVQPPKVTVHGYQMPLSFELAGKFTPIYILLLTIIYVALVLHALGALSGLGVACLACII